MEAFDASGQLCHEKFHLDAAKIIIEATKLAVAPATRALRCKPGHLLLAMWPAVGETEEWCEAVEAALSPGCLFREIPQLIEAYVGDSDAEQVFELKRGDFTETVVRALETCARIEDADGNAVWEAADEPVGVLPLLVAVLTNPSEEETDNLRGILDLSEAARALSLLLRGEGKEVECPELYSSEGSLQLEYFDDAAVSVLETARERAGGMGYDRIRPPHLFLALVERPDGISEQIIRLQARPGTGPKNVLEVLTRALTLGPGVKPRQLGLNKYHLSETLQSVIRDACVLSLRNGSETVGERFLLRAVLESEAEGLVGRNLASDELGFSMTNMIRDVDRRIRDHRLGRTMEEVTPFLIPGDVAKSEDLTYLARTGDLPGSVGQDELVERMLKALHKRHNNNVLVTGESGVGKTQLVRELARRVGAGEVPFLKRRKVVWVDCEGIPPDQSRERFYQMTSAVKGRNDVIVCLDHFENILRYSGGTESNNRAIIRVALRNRDIRLIGIIETRHYVELMSNDYSLLEMFARVEVEEVTADQTVRIIEGSQAPRLAKLYGVEIEKDAVVRAAHASREFIMSERLPVKAIKVLRGACESVSYDRETGRSHDATVRADDVVRAISERTGIDEATIGGSGSSVDFYDALSRSVVGQDQAVKTVATRMERIKLGATREGKPAAVMVFAGLTGTGKTELAKAIAKVYSASGKLSVYPMTNFSEPHSISGITGVPPGYVGYESGGRLINDLNADPYGVILFDEAEKAHYQVWQSMLSLFDEAWIEDRRNVKAYGNRAVFILTSNAGQDFIRKNYKTMPPEQLKAEVARRLVDFKNDKGERVFSPEFLGRCTDIVIFNPLSLEAMEAITAMQTRAIAREWQTKRAKNLTVDDAVVQHIAGLSYEENEKADGTKGGRVVAQYVGNLVELRALDLMRADRSAFEDARTVRVFMEPGNRIAARIEDTVLLAPSAALERARAQIGSMQPSGLDGGAAAVADELASAVGRWSGHVLQALMPAQVEEVRRAATEAGEALSRKVTELEEAFKRGRDTVLDAMAKVSAPTGGESETGGPAVG